MNGSTLTQYYNGVSEQSATDTAITGNLRAVYEFSFAAGSVAGDVAVDNFEAADLAAAAADDWPELERSMPRGLLRGVRQGVL